MTWNTRWIEDGIYYLHVRAYDGNGNMGQSEEIIVGVDNSTSSPNTISITSIELEERNYKINLTFFF